jgi:hypothetical protein
MEVPLMNSYSKQVEEAVMHFNTGNLIVANRLYSKELTNIPELAYYKSLERLVRRGELARVGKGVYSRPQKTRFGNISASEKDIINYYISNNNGLIVGYGLFNRVGLTTQVSKKTKIYSTKIKENQKTIGNVVICRLNMKLDRAAIEQIKALEILENYQKIEDFNRIEFCAYTQKIAGQYNEKAFEKVIANMKYKKRTIAFLQIILNRNNVPNNLSKYLSATSNYVIPDWEESYETA